MIEEQYSFAQLGNKPIPKVKLESIISGAIIVEIAPKRGISITLGPHETDHDVDLDWHVVAFKEGEFGEYQIGRLQSAKELGNTIYLEGSYTPNSAKGKYLGKIEATKIEIR